MTTEKVVDMHSKQIDDLNKQAVHAAKSRHTNAEHISVLKAQYEEHCRDIKEIKGDISTIKTNHLEHMEKDLANLQTDVGWIKRFFWIVATTSIGALVSGILTLIFK